MGKKPRILVDVMAMSVLVACVGCFDERPSVSSSTTEATVKGTVTIKGKPATKGQVVFDPSNYQRKEEKARTAPINSDGTYTITTLLGGNAVRVEGPEAEKAGALYLNMNYDVKSGENTYDITIPPPEPNP
jgi:hypothetical protein